MIPKRSLPTPPAAPSTVSTTVATTVATPGIPWGPTTTRLPTPLPATTTPAISRLLVQAAPPPDGRRFADTRLHELATLSRLGVRTAVVFDLDNTVFDTRHRTLQAGFAFDAAHGTTFFSGASVDVIGADGASTAAKLGLVDPHASEFVAFWDIFFWTPENLALDKPIADMVALVQAAQASGAQVTFLTGRVQTFQEASLQQLQAAGLDVALDDVICKPDIAVRTGPFKVEHLQAMARGGVELGFFVTEGSRDLLHLHGALPELPLLRLACSFEQDRGLTHLPTWPEPF
jgi:phosphoglycolate phosphatase-like HAD superfamily hydrolase